MTDIVDQNMMGEISVRVDSIIVGAGISGISFARRLAEEKEDKLLRRKYEKMKDENIFL